MSCIWRPLTRISMGPCNGQTRKMARAGDTDVSFQPGSAGRGGACGAANSEIRDKAGPRSDGPRSDMSTRVHAVPGMRSTIRLKPKGPSINIKVLRQECPE
jgi:hypothetical protein